VRQRESGVVTCDVLEPDEVEVEGARSPAHLTHAAVRRLNVEQDAEQGIGIELGLERRDRVQERRLVGDADRLGAVDGRGGDDPAAPAAELDDRRSQRGGRISQVGPESDVRPAHPLGCIFHISP
jgi:hypothetical protein